MRRPAAAGPAKSSRAWGIAAIVSRDFTRLAGTSGSVTPWSPDRTSIPVNSRGLIASRIIREA